MGDEVDILKIPKPELAELKYLEYDLDHDTPINLRISNLTGLEHAAQLITLSSDVIISVILRPSHNSYS